MRRAEWVMLIKCSRSLSLFLLFWPVLLHHRSVCRVSNTDGQSRCALIDLICACGRL